MSMEGLKDPIALVFPGMGVQRPGMGLELDSHFPAARRALSRAEEVLEMPLRRLCLEGPAEELLRAEILQPCVVAVSWAAFEVWQERYGMDRVAVVAGHSLGEFSALAAAGTLPWETVLKLVREEGRLCAEATRDNPGGMTAIVGLDEEQVDAVRLTASRKGDLWIANFNAPDQFVLSGQINAVAEAARLALDAGARRAVVLNVPVPAHSPMMSPGVEPFGRALDQLEFSAPDRPVIANGSGEPMSTVDAVRTELRHHMVRPVQWTKTMASMQELQIRTVVELGTSRVLASLAFKNIPDVQTWTADELFIETAGESALLGATTPA